MAESGILHTEAIVLRAIDFSETSRIVTLFTQEQGKMGVMAKGARVSKSRFGSTLDPMSRIATVIHCRVGRDLQILSEATHVAHHAQIRTDIERMEIGFRVIELVQALMPDAQPNHAVFGLLSACLAALDTAPGRTGNLWPFFQLRLATILGFGPSFEADGIKSMDSDHGVLDLRSGDIRTMPEEGWVPMRASRTALRAFAVFARAELADVLRMQLEEDEAREVDRLVSVYVKHHVEDAYPSRTAKVFSQIASQ